MLTVNVRPAALQSLAVSSRQRSAHLDVLAERLAVTLDVCAAQLGEEGPVLVGALRGVLDHLRVLADQQRSLALSLERSAQAYLLVDSLGDAWSSVDPTSASHEDARPSRSAP
jgi:hypothetical protein